MKICYYILFGIWYVMPSHSVSQHWEGVGGGTDQSASVVFSLLNYNDNLVVGGAFDSLGYAGIPSHGTGYWNNQQWLAGNTVFVTGLPKCFVEYNNQLIMGGGFGEVNGNQLCKKVALLDSSGWAPLGIGVTNGSEVKCMAVYSGDLFIGGQFTEVNGTITAKRIARWDGTNWFAMGTGFSGGFGNVNDMTVFQNSLYVGGFFSNVNGLPASGICKWNGSIWDTLSSGLNGPALSLYADTLNNRLYVGGQFTMAGGVNTPTGVAYWDGSNWFPVGVNPYIPARDLIIFEGKLYNASTQSQVINLFGDTIKYLAWYDGVNWIPVPGGVDATAHCFAEYQNALYVGGGFENAGDSLVYGIAKWVPGSLGINEVSENNLQMKIMPNPSKDEVILEMNLLKYQKVKLEIIDSNGRDINYHFIEGSGLVTHKFITSTIPSGVYVFLISYNNKILGSRKIIIEK